MYSASDCEAKLLEAGLYEVTIINTSIETTFSGKEYLNICFITDDGTNVYDRIFRSKDNPTEFTKYRIGQLLKAVKYEPDVNSDFELTQILKQRKLVVKVVIEHNDYKQADENVVKAYTPSEKQMVTPKGVKTNINQEVDDGDLPF